MIVLVLGLATALAAKDQRSWQPGTLLVEATTPVSDDARYFAFQEMKVYGDGYLFTLSHGIVRFTRPPNITVNGPIKYAIEKGRFYILDEDGREFRMTLHQKALVTAPAAASPAPAVRTKRL